MALDNEVQIVKNQSQSSIEVGITASMKPVVTVKTYLGDDQDPRAAMEETLKLTQDAYKRLQDWLDSTSKKG